jgi:PEP-CTERM motif
LCRDSPGVHGNDDFGFYQCFLGLAEIGFGNLMQQHNTMKKLFKRCAILSAFSSVFTAIPVEAANTFYTPGDLVLFFQQEGGTNTIYANIGNAANLYRGTAAGSADGVNRVNFLNLNSTLSTAFGSGWASDTSIYAGLAGVFNTSASSLILTDGDPSRTLYVSDSRTEVGTVGTASSNGRTVVTQTGQTSGASGINQQNNAFAVNYDSAVTISLTSVSLIDDKNPFLAPGLQGAAMNIFGGGIQQRGSADSFGTFGDAGPVEFALDLYRILGRNDLAGQVGGVTREGSYEGTVTIGTTGEVSFIANAVPEPSSLALTGLAVGMLAFRRRRSA